MIWSAMLREGEPFTLLQWVFDALEHQQCKYNFLLVGIEAYPNRPEYEFVNQTPVWISGTALTEMAKQDDFQWVWGALLAYSQSVGREQAVLETEQLYTPKAPDIDRWNMRNCFAQTKATFMILAGDSSYMELLSKDKALIDTFCRNKPLAERSRIDDTLEES